METRANYIAVGLFTLAILAAAFVGVYWFNQFGEREDLVPLDVRIQGSVSGLGPGSIVQFNGITVGRVEKLSFDPADPRFVVVHTQVNKTAPIRDNTRASIGVRGLSGGAFIQLEGGSPAAPRLLQNAAVGQPAPRIDGDPAALADLLARVNSIASRTERVMNTLESFVETNNVTVSNTFKNAETFSKALANNSDGVSSFLKSAGDVAKSLEQLSSKLDASVSRAEAILKAVDPQSVGNTVSNVEAFSKSLADQRAVITGVLETVNRTANQLNGFTSDLNQTMSKVDGIVSAVKPDQLSTALNNLTTSAQKASDLLASIEPNKVRDTINDVSAAASSARGLVESVNQKAVSTLVSELSAASANVTKLLNAIDASKVNAAVDSFNAAAKGAQTVVNDVAKVTGPLGNRSADINKIVTDTSELAARLNDASKRIDGVIAQVDSFFGSGESNGLVSDARQTLSEFRRVARNLNAQVSSVASNVNSFTRRGLSDTQTLIRDARQSLNRIDRVMRNLQDNPSSLITGAGGGRVRESTGQRPRR